jgi:hypothetical protein
MARMQRVKRLAMLEGVVVVLLLLPAACCLLLLASCCCARKKGADGASACEPPLCPMCAPRRAAPQYDSDTVSPSLKAVRAFSVLTVLALVVLSTVQVLTFLKALKAVTPRLSAAQRAAGPGPGHCRRAL